MNTRTSVFRRTALLALSALAFAACDNKTETTPPVRNTQVTITPSSATIPVGQSVTFVASVSDDTTGANSGVTYTSTNQAVATVSAAGVVTGVAPGTTTIIATSKFNTSRAAAAQVTVTSVAPTVVIAVVPTTTTLTAGQTLQLVPSVTGTTNTAVTYTSSDTSVAKVSTAGVVTATQKNGTAVITVTSAADPTRTATSVIVVQGGTQTGVALVQITPTAATININETAQFTATVSGVANTAKTFTSSDTTVATVNATTGLATAKGKAGTTTITATSSADPTKTASATLTVNRPTVTLTPTPNPISISPGQTATITTSINGAASDIAAGVTCVSADTTIATVTSPGCVVTAKNSGSTTITVRSVGDNTKTAPVTVTVAAVTQPSISIQSVTTPAGLPIAPGGTATGTINVTMNVTAGSQSPIQRVSVRLNGVEACSQPFTPPLAPTQAPVPISCPVNTAQLNSTTGAAVFPNGPYTLTADAFSTANSVSPAATATYGTLVLNNANTIGGSVTFDNSLNNTDNTPTAAQAVDASGIVWNGGTATVTVRPAIFAGSSAATVDVSVDANCDGTFESTKTATITNGSGSVTFDEAANMGGATNGINDLSNRNVCFVAGNARAADNSLVTLPAGNGTTPIRTSGTVTPVAATDSMRIDNVPPVIGVTVQPGAATTNYLANNVALASSGAANLAPNVSDCGPTVPTPASQCVGRVTTDFFAIPTSQIPGTINQANLRTVVNAQAGPTTNSNQLNSSITNTFYTLVVRSKDALGNTSYALGNQFGVDRENPVFSLTVQPTDSINPPGTDVFTFTTTDTLSGNGVIKLFVNQVTNAGNVCVDANAPTTPNTCDPFVTTTNTGTASIPVSTIAALGAGYYFVTATGSDQAGNTVAGGPSKTILIDTTNPTQGGVVVPISAQAGGTNATFSANTADNVDLRAAVPQETFGATGTIPVAANTDISGFGVPLVTSAAASATFPFIRSLTTSSATPGTPASAGGFNIEDVAFNASGPSPVAFQAGVVDNTVTGFGTLPNNTGTFVVSSNATDIDRTPGNSGANIPTSSATLTAVVTGNSNTLNYGIPFNRVMFTFTDRAGIERVLTTTTSANAGVVGNAPTENRTYTYTATLSATQLSDILGTTGGAPGGTTNVRAIGVDAEGDAIVSNTVAINVRQ